MIFRILVWLTMMVGGGALGLFLDRRWFPLLQRSVPFHALTLALGALMLWLVIRVSRNTGGLLARTGREGDLPLGETNRLVAEGVYGCMRHPIQALFLIAAACIGMGALLTQRLPKQWGLVKNEVLV